MPFRNCQRYNPTLFKDITHPKPKKHEGKVEHNRCLKPWNIPREWDLVQYIPEPKKVQLDNVLQCPLPGLVVDILVKEGERVYRGQELVVIEAMKMESGVASPCDGKVEKITAHSGQAVETGDILLTFKL